MQFNRLASNVSWIILLVLAIPSFLVLASWNSLPGDFMYPVKRGMEDLLLAAVSSSQDLTAKLSVQYSERRFVEATSLIAEKHSVVGLSYFEQQVQATQEKIQNTTDPKTQQNLKNQLVSNLQTYNQQLEETKTQVTTTNANNNVVTQTPPVNNPVTNIPVTSTPVVVVVTATPTIHIEKETAKSITTATEAQKITTVPTETAASSPVQPSSNAQIVAAIDQTQEHITKTIKELENNNQENSHQDNKQQNDNGQQKEGQKNKKD
ncbi:MAG: hypothetical protein M1120_01655 [Patescibacteria group bacterium]|nr:hypothetical protein [Patescibacteria group bacterium]